MRILAANDAMTQGALRVLGVAYRVTAELPDIQNRKRWKKGWCSPD